MHDERMRDERPNRRAPIRYAVVGLGYISQIAALPAFEHARANSRLTALVSHDARKLRQLGKKYDVDGLYSYEGLDACLREVDAVYIALPNHLHAEVAERAAAAGVHVLCEKPLAVSEDECQRMIAAAARHRVLLMTAYRLHFERGTLSSLEVAESGELGDLRYFSSAFSMQVAADNIRLHAPALGGGPIYDIGTYCINAARHFFRSEPVQVSAFTANDGEARFRETHEAMACTLRFAGDRLASFVCSAGAADLGWYEVVGTQGRLRMDPAYEFAKELRRTITVGRKTRRDVFRKRDQFAPELLYFSRCIQEDVTPEPSGREGFADVRVIRALLRSAREGRSIDLPVWPQEQHPTPAMEQRRPPVEEPELVGAEKPSA